MADGRIGKAIDWQVLTSRSGLTAIDQVRPRFPAGIFQRLRDYKGQTLRKQQTQYPTIQLPQAIFHAVGARQLAPPSAVRD